MESPGTPVSSPSLSTRARDCLVKEATDGLLASCQKQMLSYNTLLCSRTDCRWINIHRNELDMWVRLSSLGYPIEYLGLVIRDCVVSWTGTVNLKQVRFPSASSE